MGRYKKIAIKFMISIVFLLLLTQIIFVWGHLLLKQTENDILTDYFFYYYAFDIIWEGKDPSLLYDYDNLHQTAINEYGFEKVPAHGCFLYPPQFAVFLSWLSIFHYGVGSNIWTVGLSILFLIGIILFARVLFPKEKAPWYFWLGTLLLALSNVPHILDFNASNSSRLLFFLLALMIYFLYHKKMAITAGIFLGIATIFKITPMVIFIFYLLQRRWRLVFGFLISTLISTIITIRVVGWDTVWDFLMKDFWALSDRITPVFGSPTNSSIYGVIKGNFPNLSSQFFYIGFVIIIFIIYLFLLRKQRGDKQEIILISISSLIFTIHLERIHMILGFFTEMILLYYLITGYRVLNRRNTLIILSSLFTFILFSIFPINYEYFLLLIILFLSSFLPNINDNQVRT